MKALSQWLRDLVGGEKEENAPAAIAVQLPDETKDAVDGSSGSNGAADASNSDGSVEATIPGDCAGLSAGPVIASPQASFPGAFTTGWKTDQGMVRGSNEDALLVFVSHQDASQAAPPFGLFMVADGMGGHSNGEAASSLALRVAAGRLISQVYLPLLSGCDRGANQPALTEIVYDAVTRANQSVSETYPGSGCTLTYGMVLGSRLFVGHVGDSRAYLLREGEEPRQLTKDHSFVNRLIEMGQLTEQEALVHPQRNVLYRAIGQPDELEVDVGSYALKDGDVLFLCSDGLWNMLEESEIWAMMSEAEAPQSICERLVDAANEAGGSDNITVVLAGVKLE